MTSRHFEDFAHAIRTSNESNATRRKMAKLVADVCKQHNTRFKKDKFYEACDLDREK